MNVCTGWIEDDKKRSPCHRVQTLPLIVSSLRALRLASPSRWFSFAFAFSSTSGTRLIRVGSSCSCARKREGFLSPFYLRRPISSPAPFLAEKAFQPLRPLHLPVDILSIYVSLHDGSEYDLQCQLKLLPFTIFLFPPFGRLILIKISFPSHFHDDCQYAKCSQFII